MGIFADKCPRCKLVTRCAVSGGDGFVGGMIAGIPFALPTSTVQCICSACGHAFRSRPSVEGRAIPADLALGLDLEALLKLTNPDLHQARILSGLRAEPRLRDAFELADRLPTCPLRADLESELARWAGLGESGRSDLVGRVEACTRAEQFARAMAGRHKPGAMGCLLGAIAAAVVWAVAWSTLRRPGILVWALVGAAGLAAASVPYTLISATRDRRWAWNVFLPEAKKGGVPLEWVLVVLENTAPPRGANDELASLRDLAPAIREELAAIDANPGERSAGFGVSA